eukprot:6189416-Pleurochrysis_carterae.AAC.2
MTLFTLDCAVQRLVSRRQGACCIAPRRKQEVFAAEPPCACVRALRRSHHSRHVQTTFCVAAGPCSADNART